MEKDAAIAGLPRLDDLLGTTPFGQATQMPSVSGVMQGMGALLKRQRMAFAWRQADVAGRAGVSVQTVKAMEAGDAVSGESLLRILMAFGHAPDLLGMLASPHYPDLRSHERFVRMGSESTPTARRIRSKPAERTARPAAVMPAKGIGGSMAPDAPVMGLRDVAGAMARRAGAAAGGKRPAAPRR